jgi:hypothetical protein
MRDQEAGATRITVIIATIILAALAAWLPAVPAHAVQVTITVNGAVCFNSLTASPAIPATAITVNLPAVCGPVSIATKPGTPGAQAAAVGSGQNQLVIRNAVITNNGTGAATVVIDARHTFSVATSVSANRRSYGIGLNASFSRKNAANVAVLAAGNTITKTGTFTYTNTAGATFTGAIGSGINFTIPAAGSVTQNTIPVPGLSSIATGQCTSAVLSGVCLNQEGLRTLLTVKLNNQRDLVTIPGGDHTVSGDDGDGFVNAVVNSLTVAARVKGTPGLRVNPNDNGFLFVYLLCNVDFPCENVDQASLRFGPGNAKPKSVKLKDVDGDGFADLELKVRQPDTGITCNDTEASVTGTTDFPGFPSFGFDAIAGFYTGPGC